MAGVSADERYIESLRADQRHQAEQCRDYASTARANATMYREMARRADARAAELEADAAKHAAVAAEPDIVAALKSRGYFGQKETPPLARRGSPYQRGRAGGS